MKKKAQIQTDAEFDRENYLFNRTNMLEDFAASLKEILADRPSVGGKINGMNFQQMATSSVFHLIREQEEYIEHTSKTPLPYVDNKEEKIILKRMVKDAKAVFGEDYNEWYRKINN